METKINPDATYFCYDAYSTAGRPKMEAEVFDFAKGLALHRLIEGWQTDLLLETLQRNQRIMKEDHPNWKPTEIFFGRRGVGTILWLHIGESHLIFREVAGRF